MKTINEYRNQKEQTVSVTDAKEIVKLVTAMERTPEIRVTHVRIHAENRCTYTVRYFFSVPGKPVELWDAVVDYYGAGAVDFVEKVLISSDV